MRAAEPRRAMRQTQGLFLPMTACINPFASWAAQPATMRTFTAEKGAPYRLQKAIWSYRGTGKWSPSVSNTSTVSVTRYAHGFRSLTATPLSTAVPKKSVALDAASGVSVNAYGPPGPSICRVVVPRFGCAAV